MSGTLIEHARRTAGLTQDELATRAGTSRPTLSAYESGRKSPTLATTERILDVAGFALGIEPNIRFRHVTPTRGRPFVVPNKLWRLDIRQSLASVELPLSLNWSSPGRTFHLRNRADRARCYEIVLREGTSNDLRHYVDGALLIDLWSDLVLPKYIQKEWNPVIEGESG